jgi:hypothetical protein
MRVLRVNNVRFQSYEAAYHGDVDPAVTSEVKHKCAEQEYRKWRSISKSLLSQSGLTTVQLCYCISALLQQSIREEVQFTESGKTTSIVYTPCELSTAKAETSQHSRVNVCHCVTYEDEDIFREDEELQSQWHEQWQALIRCIC